MPATKQMPDAEPVPLSGVQVRVFALPEDEEPIEWFLLTTLKKQDGTRSGGNIGHYLQRCRIKDFLRVLKSGCQVEFLSFREAEELQGAIAIDAVIT